MNVDFPDRPVPNRLGVTLGVLQFFFALTWTVYALYLPALADMAGIDRRWVPWILLADQVIFAACDWAMGVAADRVARLIGRLGTVMAVVTGASALAFLLLPVVAPSGHAWLLVALMAVWSVTSSALRAPPLVLLGRHAPKPSHPWLASLTMLGIGVAGAVSPALTTALAGIDPRIPFALAAFAVMATTLALAKVETLSPSSVRIAAPAPPLAAPHFAFFLGLAFLAVGFQVHFSLNAASGFLKFASSDRLAYLMPVFWIGFSVLMLPASSLCRRFGATAVMALGALIGAGAAWAVGRAEALDEMIAAQFIAGGAWGVVMMSAFAAALSFGRTGREGLVTGAMFSLLALATAGRIALVASGISREAVVVPLLPWLPAALWLLGGAVLMWAARREPAAPDAP